MNQNPSHSNTPTFNKVKSQTTARLYQHPTEAEMRPLTGFKAFISNFCMAFVLFTCFAGIAYIVFKGTADAVDHQPQFASESHEKNT